MPGSKPSEARLPLVELPHWNQERLKIIKESLASLLDKITAQNDLLADDSCVSKTWFGETLRHYAVSSGDQCDFKIIEDNPALTAKLIQGLPFIIRLVLQCTTVTIEVPVLRHKTQLNCMFGRADICTLLANGFLCTFPDPDPAYALQNFNFYELFSAGPNPTDAEIQVKAEKISSILDYFRSIQVLNCKPQGDIVFSRKYKMEWENWTQSQKPLLDVTFTEADSFRSSVLLDFGYNYIGKQFFSGEKNFEEALFMMFPEMLIARLCCERLACLDNLCVTGLRPHSMDPTEDIEITVVTMDAINQDTRDAYRQYHEINILREMQKAYNAFTSVQDVSEITTGHWSSGGYVGDYQLKFLIQWIAASQCGIRLVYHVQNRVEQKAMENVVLQTMPTANVGDLTTLIVNFGKSLQRKRDNGGTVIRESQLFARVLDSFGERLGSILQEMDEDPSLSL